MINKKEQKSLRIPNHPEYFHGDRDNKLVRHIGKYYTLKYLHILPPLDPKDNPMRMTKAK